MGKFILEKRKMIKKLKSTMKMISIKLFKYCIKFNFLFIVNLVDKNV